MADISPEGAIARVRAAKSIGARVTIRCTSTSEFKAIQTAIRELDRPKNVGVRLELERPKAGSLQPRVLFRS